MSGREPADKMWCTELLNNFLISLLFSLHFFYNHNKDFHSLLLSLQLCYHCYNYDAPNLGCPLATRQPAEIYMSHVLRPIYVQKWPLGPIHHTKKMYILYKNDLITIVFNYNLHKTGSFTQNFIKYKIRPVWSFLRF